ncbi:MAG TPA: helix-turn-helix domain-containing protein [Vitreimonas sp.]|nr:helix-turn-helix domain-containing protein [Vitreimonas sp.]
MTNENTKNLIGLNPQPMTLEELPDLLKPAEVAQYLRVSVFTVKRWAKKGAIASMNINSRGDIRIKKEEVLKMFERKN